MGKDNKNSPMETAILGNIKMESLMGLGDMNGHKVGITRGNSCQGCGKEGGNGSIRTGQFTKVQ